MGQPKKRRSPVTWADMKRIILLILGVLTSANRPISVSTPLSVQDTSATSTATIIAEVEVGRSRPGDQTIVRVEGNGHLTCQPHRLNDPERLVLDFAGARLAARRTSIPSALKPVRGVRLGQFRPNVARVVIDLEPVAADAPYSVQSEGNTLTVLFAGSTPPGGGTRSPAAPRAPAAQEQKPVHARLMETDQQAPAPRAATGISVEFLYSGQARDLPPIQGLTLRYCTVQQTTEDEDQWTLKLSAAHGRNEEDGTPKVDWRMTYGSYDSRKKALDECDKWLGRIDKAIKQGLTERSKPEEEKHPAHDQH